MSELPTGTVTFLFTDIEGSTRLLDELGDAYAEVLGEHRRLLRETLAAHRGSEVDTQGDAFFAAFARASDAVAAARAAQQALAESPIRVRMGIHTGEPLLTAEGYVGMDVHKCARIAAAGHGGQVLLSETTARLVDAPLRDLGEHRLKDLTAPVGLYQLGEGEFAPLMTLNRTNLPIQPTSLVGRERELAEVDRLLDAHRLVTLTGPGGSGKTRLALQVAAEAAERFPDGVFLVPLQALREPGLVLPAIEQTVGAKNGLAAHVADRRILLLLDNLEHLLDCAPALADVLAATRNLEVLVTSRELLRIAGEREYVVEPLSVADAARLFVERAPRSEPREAVEEICRRVDCLPLAVELAAARTRVFAPDALLARLEQRLPLLTTGRRDAPDRQRTLRAAITWSYDLLSHEEQRVLRGLAVFSGGFDLEAAEAIARTDSDALQSLVEKSLVQYADGRFGLLETIREYALERLGESGDDDDLRRRHSEYFLAQAGRAEQGLTGDRQAAWLAVVEADHDNFRAALDWLGRAGPAEAELQLAVGLWRFWFVRGHLAEGRSRLEGALARADARASSSRAKALTAASSFAVAQGDPARAIALLHECLASNRELGDIRGSSRTLTNLGVMAAAEEDYERARGFHGESLALCREAGDARGIALSSLNLADVALAEGDYDAARELCEESLPLQRQTGERRGETLCLLNLGLAHVLAGRCEDAVAPLRESLRIADSLGYRAAIAYCLEALAAVAVGRGDPPRAARLLGSTEVLREGIAATLDPPELARSERFRTEARERLGTERFDELMAEGRALQLERAVELALVVPAVA